MDKNEKTELDKNKTGRIEHLRLLFQSKYVLTFVIFLLMAFSFIGLNAYNKYKTSQQPASKKTVKDVIVRRSKVQNVIINATTAKTIDVSTGKVIQAARVFSPNDKTIYLSLELDKPKSGTYIDYIRYLNGLYVDHGNLQITGTKVKSVNFNWTNTRPLGSIGDGKWRIATYTNGILEKRVNYIVKRNQVINIYEDQISFSDPDYYLRKF